MNARALLAVAALLPAMGAAKCLPNDGGACRYPKGDAWCAEHHQPRYAYADKCAATAKPEKPAEKPAAPRGPLDHIKSCAPYAIMTGIAVGRPEEWVPMDVFRRSRERLEVDSIRCRVATGYCTGYYFAFGKAVKVGEIVKENPALAAIALVLDLEGGSLKTILYTDPASLSCSSDSSRAEPATDSRPTQAPAESTPPTRLEPRPGETVI